jgi:hypothetical protein
MTSGLKISFFCVTYFANEPFSIYYAKSVTFDTVVSSITVGVSVTTSGIVVVSLKISVVAPTVVDSVVIEELLLH